MSRHKAPVLHGLCTACKLVTISTATLSQPHHGYSCDRSGAEWRFGWNASFVYQGYHHSARSFSDVNTDETVTNQGYETLDAKPEDKSSFACIKLNVII